MNYRRVIPAAIYLMIAALLLVHPLPAGAATDHCGKPCRSTHCQNCECHDNKSRSRDGCAHHTNNESHSNSVKTTCFCSVSSPVANGATEFQIPNNSTAQQPRHNNVVPITVATTSRLFQSYVGGTFGKHSDFRRRLLCTWVL